MIAVGGLPLTASPLSGFVMDTLELYNLALSLLDLSLDDLSTPSKELRLLNLNYNKVVSYCLRAWDFPFLLKRTTLAEYDKDGAGNPIAWNGFRYGYVIPSDYQRAVQINADKRNPFAYRFGKLWSHANNPELEYMPCTLCLDEDGNYLVPDEFLALVAYQLALHVAPVLDPDSQAMGTAAQMYQLTLSNIIESESRSNDRPSNYEASSTWDDEINASQGMLRNAIIRGEV